MVEGGDIRRFKTAASSRRLLVTTVEGAPPAESTAPETDPALGLKRLWTQAERQKRWPTLDYSQPRDLEPETDGIYGPHNACRADLTKLAAAADALGEADAPRVARLAAWFKRFSALVHQHHDIEEEILVPFLVAKGGVLPPKIMKTHVWLVAMLAKIGAAIDGLAALTADSGAAAAAGRPAAVAALRADVAEFVAEFRAHLTEEEDTVVPETVNRLNRAAEDELMAQILQKINNPLLGLEFGWMLAPASPFWRSNFTSHLPPPLIAALPQFEAEFAWHDAHVRCVYDASVPLPADAPPVLAQEPAAAAASPATTAVVAVAPTPSRFCC